MRSAQEEIFLFPNVAGEEASEDADKASLIEGGLLTQSYNDSKIFIQLRSISIEE